MMYIVESAYMYLGLLDSNLITEASTCIHSQTGGVSPPLRPVLRTCCVYNYVIHHGMNYTLIVIMKSIQHATQYLFTIR